MAKGSEEKQSIINTILSTFTGSFVTAEGKEVRIPINGMEIKVALTAAKDVIGGNATSTISTDEVSGDFPIPQNVVVETKVTEDEKANLQELMKKLNISAE